MEFPDPIVAGEKLVRDAIQSDPFVSGSVGWRVERDGDAEFNNVDMRGVWRITGSDPDAYIRVLISGDGTPIIEFSDESGNQYEINASTLNDDMRISPTPFNTAGRSSIHFLQQGGILLRSSATGAPSVLFDDDTGFLKYATYAPLVEEGWTGVTFANSWANANAPAGTYDQCQYRKMPDGTVKLRGLMVGGTIVNGTTAFTLPAGYRPTKRKLFRMADGTPNMPNAMLAIDNAGNCQIYGITAAGNGYSLEQVRFDII